MKFCERILKSTKLLMFFFSIIVKEMNIPLDQEPLTKVNHIEDLSLRVIERFKQKKSR